LEGEIVGVLVSRIHLRNYKSIASCDVRLGDLCVLVGVNGSGKSNFVDAFGFISDALNSTLDIAIRNRGGISAVRRKSGGHPNNFGMSFFLNLPENRNGFFAFEIAALPNEGFEVRKEKLHVSGSDPLNDFGYTVERGKLIEFPKSATRQELRSDRLFLTSVAGLRPFDLLFDALAGIEIYDINPDDFRLPQPHGSGEVLLHSGQNLASVLRRLSDFSPETFDRIREYLHRIVDSVESISPKSLGPTETIQFSQYVQRMKNPWKFDALNMSSGTLRSLGVLTALFHQAGGGNGRVPLIGIEEPEGTVHPAAAAVLMDAIIEASKTRQILLTTHSPELLDHPRLSEDQLYVVSSERNETRVGQADQASREAMRNRLLTAGELLRANQLTTEKSSVKSVSQAELFRAS